MSAVAVRCTGVSKSYKHVRAVDDVSFEVGTGEIFGMIGPNGAGKTTLVECVEGLRIPDAGTIEVLGLDPVRQAREVRERTGLQLQSAALPPRIRVREALELFATFYRKPADWRTVLARMRLEDKASSYVEKLSGGQRQRLFIALALINDPEIVFVDEITTGLDPQARHTVWDVIRDIRDGGATVVLTTHFMEEAERLCDRVAVVDRGRIVALDTVQGLIGSLEAAGTVTFAVDGDPPLSDLKALPAVSSLQHTGGRVVVNGTGERFAQEVMGVLAETDSRVTTFRFDQPTLEDVFLALTGREIRPDAPGRSAAASGDEAAASGDEAAASGRATRTEASA